MMRTGLHHSKCLILAVAALCLLPFRATAVGEQQAFKPVNGPCQLQFPADHGAHPDYRTEWWYYTGNLRAATGERFGFQLTFFRSRMNPPGTDQNQPASAWRTQQLFLAHAAVSDIRGKRFHHAEQMARGALGMAGASRNADQFMVFVNNWSAAIDSERHLLLAKATDFAFDLTLKPQKAPAAHGDAGYSLKGRAADSASCYYSLTRLQATGSLILDGKRFAVEGLAWMDHEFSSAPLEPDLAGWDWFSIQLDNHTELMIYLLRQKDGGRSPASSGTWIGPAGELLHLTGEMITVEVLEHWKSPHTQAVYPARWRIRAEPLRLELVAAANLADQEMRTPETTRVTYWEGSVSLQGTMRDQPVAGAGYVELTGYAEDFDAPM